MSPIDDILTKFRTSEEYMHNILAHSLKFGDGGVFNKVSAETIKEKNNQRLALGLLLLLSVGLFSGDGNVEQTTYNQAWDSKPSIPFGYDREGNPVFDNITPLYFDQNGNRKW